jgi:hypothetical protein
VRGASRDVVRLHDGNFFAVLGEQGARAEAADARADDDDLGVVALVCCRGAGADET